jgi:uncharacterized protein (DUF952 family)
VNIFHIVSRTEWDAAAAAGEYAADSLASEGFIHFSFADQVSATANRYYRALDGLQVIEVDPALVPAVLKLEPSPLTGEVFPHIYGALPTAAVIAIHPLRREKSGDYVFQP